MEEFGVVEINLDSSLGYPEGDATRCEVGYSGQLDVGIDIDFNSVGWWLKNSIGASSIR